MCVEVAQAAVQWRKSSHSGGASGQCVEVGQVSAVIGIRDSKDPDAGHLAMDQAAFAELLTRVKVGTFDL